MDRKIQLGPDYRRIYTDIINKKNPEKREECRNLLVKKELSVMDVLELNKKIFGEEDKTKKNNNHRFRSYQKSDILQILDYQRKNNLNNIQLANHFKTSRNTIAKWRKIM